MKTATALLAAIFLFNANLSFGAEPVKPTETARELAEQDQNPIARIIRMQIEDNVQFGFGPGNGTLNFLRLQPSAAFGLGRHWSLITRLVLPIVHQPWPEPANGIGDIALQLFLTPNRGKNETLAWGLGPGFVFPSASDKIISTEKWSVGPAGILIYKKGPWVLGLLVNQLWSFAGSDQRPDLSGMTIRPLLNFNLPHGWYLTSSPSIAANWKAPNSDRWLLPVGAGVGKAFVLGSHGLTTTLEAYSHVLSPKVGPDWQLRFQTTILFPR